MSNFVTINDDIYWAGVNDRTTELFEAIWPLPQGISYNSYLINDDKVAVIDTVKDTYIDQYLRNIKEFLGEKNVDYLIINHMEPDHSGAIQAFIDAYPEVKIVGNKKTMDLIEAFYGLSDNLKTINEDDQIDLGQHKLKFFMTPMVHWPETMMTYDLNAKILYSGDAFGGFGTLDGGIFDDEVNIDLYEKEIRRYFSNIVGKYALMVKKAINKLGDLDIDIVAPTHGPIWRDNPDKIINDYLSWSNHEKEDGVVIVYGSMYGNTEKMAEEIARELAINGVKEIKMYNISKTHVSHIINDIWKYKGLILGSCTYNTGLFPPMDYLLRFLENKGIKNNVAGIFGSYSWSGGALDRLEKFVNNINCELIEPAIEIKSSPGDKDLSKGNILAQNLAKKIVG